MSGISDASVVIAARKALYTAAQAALADDDDVDVYPGFTWPVSKNAWAALTRTTTATEDGPLGATNRSQEETVSFHMSIGAFVSGHGATASEAAFDRAFAILSLIQNHIRKNDIELGGTVRSCKPGDVQSDGIEDGDGEGYVVEIDAEFICTHRIRSN